jgi:hypothetical protein
MVKTYRLLGTDEERLDVLLELDLLAELLELEEDDLLDPKPKPELGFEDEPDDPADAAADFC